MDEGKLTEATEANDSVGKIKIMARIRNEITIRRPIEVFLKSPWTIANHRAIKASTPKTIATIGTKEV